MDGAQRAPSREHKGLPLFRAKGPISGSPEGPPALSIGPNTISAAEAGCGRLGMGGQRPTCMGPKFLPKLSAGARQWGAIGPHKISGAWAESGEMKVPQKVAQRAPLSPPWEQENGGLAAPENV